ncbi:MAG: HigA family addiction module antidote protein [Burkholderiales bacterium]|nr:HigA family addiction module antidote protein [Burkholderiales bacterium]
MAKNTRSLRDPKRRPTHPGEILREDVLPALRMTQTELAQRLGVSRLTVSEILHEKRPVSVDMAIRIGKLLGNGAGLWLRLQQALDVWELEQQGGYEGIEQVDVKAA